MRHSNTAPQVKGTNLIAMVKAVRANRQAALRVLPEGLHHYLDETILYSNWYPEADNLRLLGCLAEILPDPGMDRWEFIGREATRGARAEVYDSMVLTGQPGASVKRLGHMWRLHHDSGRLEVTLNGNAAEVELREFPCGTEEFGRMLTGFLWGLLERAGARGIKVKNTEALRGGQARWQALWETAA